MTPVAALLLFAVAAVPRESRLPLSRAEVTVILSALLVVTAGGVVVSQTACREGMSQPLLAALAGMTAPKDNRIRGKATKRNNSFFPISQTLFFR